MSKQVKTPRFYVDIPTFLHASGYADRFSNSWGGQELLYMDPSQQFIKPFSNATLLASEGGENTLDSSDYYTTHMVGRGWWGRVNYPINFIALLNHNLGHFCSDEFYTAGLTDGDDTNDSYGFACGNLTAYIAAKRLEYDYSGNTGHRPAVSTELKNAKNILNSAATSLDDTPGSIQIKPKFNGTSIFEFDEKHAIWSSFGLFFKSSLEENAVDDLDNRNALFNMFDEDGSENDGSHGVALGSYVVGRYWEPPHSPDLNLTMSRRFDGIKKQKTIGGKMLSNIYYDGPTEWSMDSVMGWNGEYYNTFNYPPFELSGAMPSSSIANANPEREEYGGTYYKKRAKSGLGRKGFRTWKLTFSYISDDDMWMAYEHSNTSPFDKDESGTNIHTESDIPTDGLTASGYPIRVSQYGDTELGKLNPMLTDQSFNYVWNVTLGGTLPFIFQPDAPKYDSDGNKTQGNNNPDQFAICRFKNNSFKATQSSHNVYDISLSIEEAW